jgi:hypothetical protein
MSIFHYLHLFIIRHGRSIVAVTCDFIVVAIAIGIGWKLEMWVAPVIARLCPFLIC